MSKAKAKMVLGRTREQWDEASVLYEHRYGGPAKNLFELDEHYDCLMRAEGVKDMAETVMSYSRALNNGIKPHAHILIRELLQSCAETEGENNG